MSPGAVACPVPAEERKERLRGRRVVLAGNPNVGKSVLFGALTGVYREVSNYPGTTVEIARGRLGGGELLDAPGVYGVSSFNDEERVAREAILGADVILNVVDGLHPERDLFLTLQLIDMGLPVVVALNFMDELQGAGLSVDVARLEELLGVEIVPTAAVKGEGVEELRHALERARPGRRGPALEGEIGDLLRQGMSEGEALLLLEGDEETARRLGLPPGARRDEIYRARRELVNAHVAETVRDGAPRKRLRELLGRAAVNPLTGVPLMAVVLYALYQVIGLWVAGDVVGLTEETLMQGIYEPRVRAIVGGLLPLESLPGQLLAGDFGILTMAVTYLAGLLLPLVLGFYLCLSLLEDSGYLPRLATLVDRLMTAIGLNGRAIVPIILGFGCVQLGTLTTRLLETGREKTIASAILAFAIPCSAQIGVIAGMLAAVGGRYVLLYGAVITACLALLGTALDRLLPGRSAPLLIDLPPLRLPRLGNVLRKTASRSRHFMAEAAPWFLLGALAVGLLHVSGGLKLWQAALAPLTEGWLGLPAEAATAFVMGMVRRDFGAAGLTDLALSPAQVVVSLVVITLFVPCIASLMVLFKERGLREASLVWVGSWVAAFLTGGLLARVILP